ncbi:MAG: hypothetical protein ACT4OT_07675 [Acidobacteriota bacterium]
MKTAKNTGIIIIVLAALTTVGIMASTTSTIGSFSDVLITLGFYVWVTLPYVVLIALTLYIYRKGSEAARVAILVTSILVAVSSVVLYWSAIFKSESSTSALVFVFIPLYSFVAIAVGQVALWLVLRLLMQKPNR